MSQDRLLVWKIHWKERGWVHTLGRVVSGIVQGRVNSVRQDDGDSDMTSTGACTKKSQKIKTGFFQYFYLGESCPTRPCTKARQCSSTLCVSSVFWVFPQHGNSEKVSPSPCTVPLREIPGAPAAPHLTHCTCWFSQSEVIGTSLSSTVYLGWESWCGAGSSHFSEGSSASETSLPIFTCHTWLRG